MTERYIAIGLESKIDGSRNVALLILDKETEA